MEGVTHAWLGNYTSPVLTVLREMSDRISGDIIPPERRPSDSLTLLQPLIAAYDDQSFEDMKTAIFPSFFHGKCQQDGVDPPGCPNPDCPVVCGTPGSMVHFYSKLRFIVYNQTRHILEQLAKPGSKTYQQVERTVLERSSNSRRTLRYMRRDILSTFDTERLEELSSFTTRTTDAQTNLKNILGEAGPLLEQACGGTGTGVTNGLPDCSWEGPMKEFILSYP
ncbi:hypothetical protein OE88DRAFT_1663258 [Heliocybe sulcata]|uniref:Uncharacterized protein n=1 Tax=Heliocybe sulcata TaxID=5364 RepID=A0A5C3MVS7_9AGAM|nr:hypothetical protein OE88DRAFT_1663258 [Heliocybe sulcata]